MVIIFLFFSLLKKEEEEEENELAKIVIISHTFLLDRITLAVKYEIQSKKVTNRNDAIQIILKKSCFIKNQGAAIQ